MAEQFKEKQDFSIKSVEDTDTIECDSARDSTAPRQHVGRTKAIDGLIGTTIDDRYHVLELLGKGGSSSVYRVEDLHLERIVALKLLHSHLASDDIVVERFEREAHTGQSLTHPNIINVDSWATNVKGQVYMTMELVEGQNLQEAIQTGLSVKQVLSIAAQICAALSAAHDMGVVHRDLKPGNIMLTESDNGAIKVKVLDFGIAKILPINGDTVLRHTHSADMLGSFLYMSPEQCLDQDVDERSDIYSLGCVLYEAFTGRPPLIARTVFETMNKHLTEIPKPLKNACPGRTYPEGLDNILLRALSKKAEERYQTIQEFQSALAALETGSASKDKRIPAEEKTAITVIEKGDERSVFTKSTKNIDPVTVSTLVDPSAQVKELKDILTALFIVFFCISCTASISSIFLIYIFYQAFQELSLSGNLPPVLLAFICSGASIFSLFLIIFLTKYNQKLKVWKKHGLKSHKVKLLWSRINVLQIKQARGNYNVKLEKKINGAPEMLQITVANYGISQDVWKQLKISAQGSDAIEYPLPGYLFCDDSGEPMAISIQRDIGWIVD